MAGSDLIRVVSKRSGSYAAAFSPDGESVACLKRNVTLWETGRKKRLISAHPLSHPSHIAFAPDGSAIAVKNTAGDCVLLDSTTLETVRELGGAEYGEGKDLLLTERGEVIDTSRDGDRVVRDYRTGSLLLHAHTGLHTTFAGATDRTAVAYAEVLKVPDDAPMAAAIWVWRAPFLDNSPQLLCDRLKGVVYALAISTENVALMKDSQLEVRSATSGEIVARKRRGFGASARTLSWWPGTDFLVATTYDCFMIYDRDLNEVGRIPNAYPSRVAFTRDGSRAFLAGWEESLLVDPA